jgi:hypothetical protein
MYVVVQRHLGKGGLLRASCYILPNLWRSSGIELLRTSNRFAD